VRKEQANKNQQNGYRYGQERCDEKAGYRCQNIADGVDDAAASVVGYNRRYRVTSYDHRGIFDQLPSTSERSGNRQAPRNPRTCPGNEVQHRVKKDAAGQVAVSVRIYEVLGHFAIIDPSMKDLDGTARTDERTPYCVQGRGREQ